MPVNPIPNGYNTVIPYLVVPGAARFLDFVTTALGAVVSERIEGPEGLVHHAEFRLGDSLLMVADACERAAARPGMLYHYVTDVDAVYERALAAGATTVSGPTDQFYGDRTAAVADGFGIEWHFATHVEDVTPEEIQRRAEAARAQAAAV